MLSGKTPGGGSRAAGGGERHLRAHPRRPLGAAELAHLLRRLQRAAVQPAGPDQHRERQAHRPRVGLPGRHERHHRRRVDLLVRGRPDRRRRDHVPLRLGRLGLGAGREDRHGDLAVQARGPLRRVAVLRERQPRGRRGQGQGLLRHGERPRARARRHHRQAGLGQDLRRRAGRGERHGRAAGREEHGHRRAAPAGSSGCAVTSTRSTSRPASTSGAATRSRSPGSPAPRPGPPTARPGRAAARTAGSPAPSTRRPTCCTWGTGNPAPDFDGEVREGDNLYTDSIIAVDVDAGQIRWHYQCTPHDVWDYDSIAECILFETDGRKLLGHFDKNGYFFVLDRTNGELVSDHPLRGPDHLGGDHAGRPGDGQGVPRRRRANRSTSTRVRPAPRNGPTRPTARRPSSSTSRSRTSGPRPPAGAGSSRRAIPYWGAGVQVDIEDMAGYISAFDANGEEKWRWRNELPMCASVLATGGDLVFAGEPSGRVQRARRPHRGAAVAVPVRQRPPQQPDHLHRSTAGSTSPCRSAGAAGPRGSCPACSARATAAR